MSDDYEWFEETMDILSDPPESVLEGVYPMMSGTDNDEGESYVYMSVDGGVSFEDLEWISESVDGRVSVAGRHAGELAIKVVQEPENGGEEVNDE